MAKGVARRMTKAGYPPTRKADNKFRAIKILTRRYGPMANAETAEQFNCIIESAVTDACRNC